MAQPNFHAHR